MDAVGHGLARWWRSWRASLSGKSKAGKTAQEQPPKQPRTERQPSDPKDPSPTCRRGGLRHGRPLSGSRWRVPRIRCCHHFVATYYAPVQSDRKPAWAILIAAVVLLGTRSEEHTSELQSRPHLVCRLL